MTPLDPGRAKAQDPGNPLDAAIGPDSVEIKPWQARLVLFQRIAGD